MWCDWKSGEVNRLVAQTVFQFQCGAIGRQRTSSKTLDWVRVSIPVWCDWKLTPAIYVQFLKQVSIPVWCDWKCWLVLVSIGLPRFNSSVVRLEDFFIMSRSERDWCFNSSVVRLEENALNAHVHVIIPFQFQCGAIGSLPRYSSELTV